MNDYRRPLPSIDKILRSFFAKQRQCRPIRADRSLRLESHLRTFLEASGPAYLSGMWQALVQMERSFEPQGAFVRLLPADHLLPPLHEFLSPEWLMENGTDRLVQVNHSYWLVCWLCGSGQIDLRARRPDIVRFMQVHDELALPSRSQKREPLIPEQRPAPSAKEDITIRREDFP